MPFSDIINYPLSFLGLKLVRLSRLNQLQKMANYQYNITDIELDAVFQHIYYKIKDYSLVGIERCYALYKSVLYVIENNIQGDFVECGVWKGGSCMLMAYTLMENGVTDRKIWLYDTFSGMVQPGENDGEAEKKEWELNKITEHRNNWCLGEIEEVEQNLLSTGYPADNIRLIKGKVEDTIPATIPGKIAILRLDTDWYDSTKHELVYLYPLLQDHGILMIDDYGAWQGARKATDEYFRQRPPVFFNRVDYTGRLIVK
jgi:O-methyltransferase